MYAMGRVFVDLRARGLRHRRRLVHLLLLVEAVLAGSHVDEQEKAADNGEDLEEVVLGEVLVRVVLVEL
jgi:hypothetical protein